MLDFYIHPIFVHFPIAFLTLETGLLLLWVRKLEEFYERAAYVLLRISVVTLILAMLGGFIDTGFDMAMIFADMHWHFYISVLLFLFVALRYVIYRRARRYWKDQAGKRFFYFLWSLATTLLTFLSAFLGGRLVYL